MEELENAARQAKQAVGQVSLVYRSLPLQMTRLKMDLFLNRFTYHQRLLLLCAGSVLTTFLSKKAAAGPLRFVRNTVITFGLTGLFIAPQIYNPIFA